MAITMWIPVATGRIWTARLATIFKNTWCRRERDCRFYEQALLRDPDDALTHVLLAEAFKDQTAIIELLAQRTITTASGSIPTIR